MGHDTLKSLLISIIYITFSFISYSKGASIESDNYHKKLSAGGEHTCILNDDSGVHCWGSGKSGQLGHKVNMSSDRPVVVISMSSYRPLRGVKQLSTGAYHNCVLKNNGVARCWGYGGHGQLGHGNNLSSNIPVAVMSPNNQSPLSQLQQISAGDHHTCAINDSGNVYCWGQGDRGQLGHGQMESTHTPVAVMNINGVGTLSGVASISSGAHHTCALKDNHVYCWGSGLSGQLGYSQSTDSSYPIAIEGNNGILNEVKQVQSGHSYSCALTFSGEVLCWGRGSHGQLGHGSNADSSRPVNVLSPDGNDTLQHIKEISLGNSHACALTEDHEVRCWGDGKNGRLGNGRSQNLNIPVKVVSAKGNPITDINQISAGRSHTCALKNDQINCWGKGSYGRLGNGDNKNSYIPTGVVEVSPKKTQHYHHSLIEKLSAGNEHTCVVQDIGDVLCWGKGSYGRLGNGSSDRNTPIKVMSIIANYIAPDKSIQVSAGGEHTCAVRDNQAFCWGRGNHGQLGTGDNLNHSLIPIAVVSPTSQEKLNNIHQISTGDQHTCVLNNDREVLCWGYGGNGQLGQGSYTNTNIPHPVVNTNGLGVLDNIEQISLGGDHSCALKVDGRILCWGKGLKGQLGHGSNEKSNIPVLITSSDGETLVGFEQVSSGDSHTCALKYNGEVLCWGKGGDGRLGNADSANQNSNTPVQAIANDVEQIDVGKYHSCALMGDGTVFCWGLGSHGQLGHNSYKSSNIPQIVKDMNGQRFLRDIKQISGGGIHTCALKLNGKIFCWGNGDNGQLGNNLNSASKRPTLVVARSGAITPFKRGEARVSEKISVGNSYACAVKENKTVLCWGYGGNGQLGNGQNSQSRTSVVVLNHTGNGPLTEIKQISSGPDHTCGVKKSSKVLCWGEGDSGQLGNGEYDNSNIPVFVRNIDGVGDLRGVQQVSTGYEHTCALKKNRTVLCWGGGSSGKLGNGAKNSSSLPVLVTDVDKNGLLRNIQQISTGDWHTCAVDDKGQVFCWGYGGYGVLGDLKSKSSSFPVAVFNVAKTKNNVEQVSAGSSHNCVLTYDGNVFCWGLGTYGQLGNGEGNGKLTISRIPVAVLNTSGKGMLKDIEQIKLGNYHSCAINRSGRGFCWGTGSYGELGNGGFPYTQSRPTAIRNQNGTSPLESIKEIAAGSYHTCSLQDNGKSFCWGDGEFGQLGNNQYGDANTPRPVLESNQSNIPLDLN